MSIGFEQIFQNLLGVTAIFDTTEHAREAARKVNYQVRMVTLDGTELRTGGSYARWCQSFPKYGLCQTRIG